MKLLFENWRKFLNEARADDGGPVRIGDEESEESNVVTIDNTPEEEEFDFSDEPLEFKSHKAVDLESKREIVKLIEKAAAEKLKTLPGPNKGLATVVPCWAGNCYEQQMANLHAPLWSRSSAIKEFMKLIPGLERKDAKKMKKHLKTDEPGILGMSAMGATRAEMTSKSRKKEPRFIVVHSALTDNPRKTVTVLQARGKMVPNLGRGEAAASRAKKRLAIDPDRGPGLSTNYEIYFDGTIYEYFPGEIQTTHAGFVNDYSIGVDLTGTTQELYDKEGTGTQHTPEQFQSLRALIASLQSEWPHIGTKVAPLGKKIFKNVKQIIDGGYGVISHENINAGRSDPGDAAMTAIGAVAENLKRKK